MIKEIPTNDHEMVVVIRPSFMKFCGDGCQSAIFNHALYWISKKAKRDTRQNILQGKVYWYATTEEIAENLAGAWGESKVRQEVNNLIKMGLLGKTKNPIFKQDRTKYFFFGPEQCKKLLDLCEEHKVYIQKIGLPDDLMHLIDVLVYSLILPDANGESTICIWSIYDLPQADQARANRKSTGPLTKSITKITTETVRTYEPSHSSISPSEETKPASIFTAEEEKLLSWLTEAGTDRRKDDAPVKDQLQTLLPHVKTKEQATSLYLYTKERVSDGKVKLGNVVKDYILKAWLQKQEPTQEQIITPPAPTAQIGMSKEQATDLLYNNILELYPTMSAFMAEDEGLYFIGITKGENDWIDICNPDQWAYLSEDEINQALAYSSVAAVAV